MNNLKEAEVVEERGITSEILTELFNSQLSPALLGLYVRAIDVSKDFGLDLLEEELEQLALLVSSDRMEVFEVLTLINEKVVSTLVDIVDKHSIKLNPEVRLLELVDIVEAIYNLTITELSEDILNTLDMQEDNTFTICRILALVGGQTEHDYMNDVWDVDKKFLDNLRILHTKQLENVNRLGGYEVLETIQKQVRRFHKFLNTDNTRTNAWINLGLELGLPLSLYLNRFGDELNLMKDANVAVEFYELFLISIERNLDPVTLSDMYLRLLVADETRLQSIRLTIRNISNRYVHYSRENPL